MKYCDPACATALWFIVGGDGFIYLAFSKIKPMLLQYPCGYPVVTSARQGSICVVSGCGFLVFSAKPAFFRYTLLGIDGSKMESNVLHYGLGLMAQFSPFLSLLVERCTREGRQNRKLQKGKRI